MTRQSYNLRSKYGRHVIKIGLVWLLDCLKHGQFSAIRFWFMWDFKKIIKDTFSRRR